MIWASLYFDFFIRISSFIFEKILLSHTPKFRGDYPGKPMQNGFVESFNGRFRAECLNAHWFLSPADAAEKLEDWRKDYNEHRRHGAIGNKVPMDLMKSEHAASPCS